MVRFIIMKSKSLDFILMTPKQINIVDNDNAGKLDRVRFEYIYNSEVQILKGLDEFHRCAKFCTSEKPFKIQKRNDYESSNSRK